MRVEVGIGIAVALAVFVFALVVLRAQRRSNHWARLTLREDPAPSAPERRGPPAGANLRSSVTAPVRLTSSTY
jgi:hypothetical protein